MLGREVKKMTDCNCEQLSNLREKSQELRDLGEEIREYAESSPEDIFSRNALVQRIERSDDCLEDYADSFIKACREGRVYASIKGLRVNPEMTHLAAASEHMLGRRLSVTYYCAACDEELLGES